MQNAKISAACIAGAVLLNILPWFGGPGWIWSALLLGGAAWLWFGRPQQSHFVVWALVACAHALDNFYIGLGAIPWLVGAVYSLRAIWPLLDWSRLRRGYAPYAIIGALACLWTQFWTWGKVAGWTSTTWTGGLDLNQHFDTNGNSSLGLDYNPTKWLTPFYMPGWDYTGRSIAGAFNASLIVLAILGWVLWHDEDSRHRTRVLPLAGVSLLLLWVFPALKGGYNGPWAFAIGAVGIAFCALRALKGESAGKYDLEDVTGRIKERINTGKAPRGSG